MQYNKFEDLPVWQSSRKFINAIYKTIGSNPKLSRDFSLTGQLKRATYSIALNIAEGFERRSNKEFSNFINIAKGSAGEVRCILYILLDNNYISREVFQNLHSDITDISAALSNFRKYLLTYADYKK